MEFSRTSYRRLSDSVPSVRYEDTRRCLSRSMSMNREAASNGNAVLNGGFNGGIGVSSGLESGGEETGGGRSFSMTRQFPLERSENETKFSSNIRPSSSMISLHRPSNYELSTTKRMFKFTQDGFNMSRASPIVHKTNLKIGIEGARDFSPEKRQAYRAFNVREICSARPGGRYRPSSVTTGKRIEGPLMSRSESKVMYDDRARVKPTSTGTVSPNSTISSVSDQSLYSSGSSPTNTTNNHKTKDERFSAGSTTRSTFTDFTICGRSESLRPRPVMPTHNLRMEGDFARDVSSKIDFQEKPYSRIQANPRREMMEPTVGRLQGMTTYNENINSKAMYDGLRRSSRFDQSLKIPDKIDWI